MNGRPPLDDAAHLDGLLMAELTSLNTQIGRYVLHFLAGVPQQRVREGARIWALISRNARQTSDRACH